MKSCLFFDIIKKLNKVVNQGAIMNIFISLILLDFLVLFALYFYKFNLPNKLNVIEKYLLAKDKMALREKIIKKMANDDFVVKGSTYCFQFNDGKKLEVSYLGMTDYFGDDMFYLIEERKRKLLENKELNKKLTTKKYDHLKLIINNV